MSKNSKPIILKSYSDDSKFPYFLQNDEIGGETIYIVQRAESIAHALFILDTWNSERYNVGEIDRWLNPDEEPYTKYQYNNNLNIKKVDVNGGDEYMKILVYKKEGKIYTSALLKFK